MTDLARRLLLCVIPDLLCGRGRSLEEQARRSLEGGATVLQLRHKEASSRQLYEEARAFRRLCDAFGALFIVNDRLDVALASGADGVHLGPSDLPVAAARRLVSDDFIVGASARTVEAALRAQAEGADYLGVGALFPTGTKEEAVVIGVEGLRQICQATELPVLAIGGIRAGHVKDILAAQARGIAVASAVAGADDPATAARAFLGSLLVP